MTEHQTIELADRAADFEKLMAGKMSKELVSGTANAIAASTLAATTSYAANGSIASLIFYQRCQCSIKTGKTFDGHTWGFAVPGGGALIGDVYLANGNSLDSLYAHTSNFTITATPVYTAFYFKDHSGNLLGHFQAGSISTVAGAGGGSGSWS